MFPVCCPPWCSRKITGYSPKTIASLEAKPANKTSASRGHSMEIKQEWISLCHLLTYKSELEDQTLGESLPSGSTKVSAHFLLFLISGSGLQAGFLLSSDHSSTPSRAWTVCEVCAPSELMRGLRLKHPIHPVLWVSGGWHSGELKPKVDAPHLSLRITLPPSDPFLNVCQFWSGPLLNAVENKGGFVHHSRSHWSLWSSGTTLCKASFFPEIMNWKEYTPYYWFFFNYFSKQKEDYVIENLKCT